jgi:hypothetical protein
MTGRHHLNPRFAPDRRSSAYRGVVASSLWLRAGFVALSVAALALIMLASGEASPWVAIATTVAGGAVAAVSWRRARAIIDSVDAAEAVGSPSETSVARPGVGFDAPVESAASR